MRERKRGIGLASATALVIANMIGAGVFTTSGFALADLGRPDFVLLAWFVGGGIALLGALSYAALAVRMPQSGGEYHYLTQTVHPLAGFLAGWVSLLAGFTAPIAVAALTLQEYLVPVFEIDFEKEWIGTAAIAVAFLMHGVRRSHGVWIQNTAVLLKVVLIIGFISAFAFRAPELPAAQGAYVDVAFDLGRFAVTLVWISFSYAGFNAAVYLADEVRDPRRNVARAVWMGCVSVTVLYLALNAAFVYSAPVEELKGHEDIGARAALALGGDGWRRATCGVVALALVTSISAMMMVGPRVYARMAEDGLFPKRVVPRGETPVIAVAFQSALAILVVWWTGLAELLGYIGFTLSLSTAATVLGLLRLRAREGAAAVPIPGFPFVPVLFVVLTLGAAGYVVVLNPGEAAWGVYTVLAGVPLYWWMRRRKQMGTTSDWDPAERE